MMMMMMRGMMMMMIMMRSRMMMMIMEMMTTMFKALHICSPRLGLPSSLLLQNSSISNSSQPQVLQSGCTQRKIAKSESCNWPLPLV